MAEVKEPIRIWDFYEAPEELRFPFNGGDEDLVILIPPGQSTPYQLQTIGCCCNDEYEIGPDGTVFEISEEVAWDEGYDDTPRKRVQTEVTPNPISS